MARTARLLSRGKFALMFCTYCDFSPNSDTSQNWSPTRLPPSGVRRDGPDLRPVVSRTSGSAVAGQRVAHPFLEGLGDAVT